LPAQHIGWWPGDARALKLRLSQVDAVLEFTVGEDFIVDNRNDAVQQARGRRGRR